MLINTFGENIIMVYNYNSGKSCTSVLLLAIALVFTLKITNSCNSKASQSLDLHKPKFLPGLCKYRALHLFAIFLPSVRCLNLVPHQRPLPSALDCWNTRRWLGCLLWRHVHMPSLMSCVNPTPACPADENCHFSSISVLLVSLPPGLCFIFCYSYFVSVVCDLWWP